MGVIFEVGAIVPFAKFNFYVFRAPRPQSLHLARGVVLALQCFRYFRVFSYVQFLEAADQKLKRNPQHVGL